jgi:hypothetical protein
MSHTPGPWYVVPLSRRDYYIKTKDGCVLAKVQDFDGDCEMANQGGKNALLMAAAPKMAAALRKIKEPRHGIDIIDMPDSEARDYWAHVAMEYRNIARAALADAGINE